MKNNFSQNIQSLIYAVAIGISTFAHSAPYIAHGNVVEDKIITQAVVALKVFNNPYSWSLCTGTLISENVVLTAGHCFNNKNAHGQIIFGTDLRRFLVGFQNTQTDIIEFKAEDVLVHPAYCGTGCSHDLALINFKTNKPSKYSPIPISKISAKNDDQFRIIGFGRNENDLDEGLMRFIDAKVNRLQNKNDNLVVNSFVTPDDKLRINPAGTKEGDSGGPVLKMLSPGGYEIVAVVSGKQNSNDYVFTNTATDRSWIEEVVKGFNGELISPASIHLNCESHNSLKTRVCNIVLDVERPNTEGQSLVSGQGILECKSTITGTTTFQKKLTSLKYSGAITGQFKLETEGLSIEATSQALIKSVISYPQKNKIKRMVGDCSLNY